jgi:hypothetical protein
MNAIPAGGSVTTASTLASGIPRSTAKHSPSMSAHGVRLSSTAAMSSGVAM